MQSLTPVNLYTFHCLSGITGQHQLFSGSRNMGHPSCCASVRPNQLAHVPVCPIYRYTDSLNALKLLFAVVHENVYH
jgi:hypothetical protein